MSVDGFINRISLLFGPEDARTIMRSLHQDPLVWRAVLDWDFLSDFIDYAQSKIDCWTPGNLAAWSIDPDLVRQFAFDDLSQRLPDSVTNRAEQAYETTRSTGLAPESLAQAGLLALALREYRIKQTTWQGITNKLQIRENHQISSRLLPLWKTVFTILPDFIPDFSNLSQTLITEAEPELIQVYISLVIHGLVSSSGLTSIYSDKTFDIFSHLGMDAQIMSLQSLVQSGYPDMAKKIAARYLQVKENLTDFALVLSHSDPSNSVSLNNVSLKNSEFFHDVQTLQRLAKLYHFAGLTEKAKETTSLAINALNQTQSRLYDQLAFESLEFDNDFAIQAWQKAVSLDPHANQVKFHYARHLVNQDEVEKAMDILTPIVDSAEAKYLAVHTPALREGLNLTNEDSPSIINAYFSGQKDGETFEFDQSINAIDRIKSVSLLKSEKKYRSALTFVERALSDNPSDMKLLKLAFDLYKHVGDLDAAIDQASLISIIDPEDEENIRNLAALYEQSRQFGKALEQHKMLISASPSPTRKELLAYASIAVEANEPEVAIPICRNFLNQDQLDGEALVILGNAYIKQGNTSIAIEQMERAASISPESPSSWLALANIWLRLGEIGQALDTLQKAQTAIPDDPQILLALGKAYLEHGLPSDALPILKKTVKEGQDNLQGRIYLAKAYHILGHTQEAWRVLEVLEEHYIQDPQLALILGLVMKALEEKSKALPILKFAYKSSRSDEAFEGYALLLLDLVGESGIDERTFINPIEELEEMLSVIPEYITSSPNSFRFQVLSADIEMALGNKQKAYQDYLDLLNQPESRAPKNYQHIQLGIGKAALALHKFEISLAALHEAVMSQSEDPEIRQVLAEAFIQAGLIDDGLASARAAFQVDPQNIKNILWFASFMIKQGHPQPAIQALKDAIRLDPTQRELYLTLAKIYVSLGDHPEAKEVLNEMIASKGISTKDLVKAANIFYHLNDVIEAAEVLNNAVQKQQKPDFEVLMDLAYTLQKIGEKESALNLIVDHERNFTSDVRYQILKSDILSLNLLYDEALACLGPLLKKVEYTEDLLGNNVTIGENLVNNIVAYNRSGLFWRASQLERITGDLLQAQKHADQAISIDPDLMDNLKLVAEISFALYQKDKVDDQLIHAINLIDKISAHDYAKFLQIVVLRCEIALMEQDFQTASDLFNQYLANNESSSTYLALQSRLAYHFREDKISEANFDNALAKLTASKALSTAQQKSISDRFNDIWDKLALGLTAWDLNRWDTAFSLLQEATSIVQINPLPSMLFAEFLLANIHAQMICQSLRIVTHAPSTDTQDPAYQRLFEEQLAIAGRFLNPDIINRLQAKGQAILSGEIPENDNLETLISIARDAAQILPILTDKNKADKVLAAFPDDFDVFLQKAILLLEEGSPDCDLFVKKLIESDTANPSLHALMAFCHQDDPPLALQAIKTALHLWPDEPEWHAYAADLYYQNDQFDLAAHHLEQALEISPLEASYWQLLGEVKLHEKDFQSAKAYFAKAVDIFQTNPEALASLANINKRLGDFQAALTCLQKAAELSPDESSYSFSIAETLLEKSDFEGAMSQANILLESHPDHIPARLIMIKALAGMKQFEQAQNILKAAISQSPDALSLKLAQVELTLANQGANAALPMAIDLSKLHPDDTDVLYILASLLIEAGKDEDAGKVMHHTLEIDSNQSGIYLLQGRINRKNGNLDQAIAQLSNAITLDPSLVDAYIELGKTYQLRREHPQALQVYDQASQVVDKDPRPHFHAGLAFKECKDYRRAEEKLRKAAQLAPNDASIRRQLAAVITLNLVHNLQEAPRKYEHHL